MSRRPLLFCRGAILLAACRAAPAFNSPCPRSNAAPRLHRNKLATALANKLARITWGILLQKTKRSQGAVRQSDQSVKFGS